MNAPRFVLTRAGLVTALFVGAVASVLIVVALRSRSGPESFKNWIYPNSSPFAAVTNSEVFSGVFMTGDSFTNVVNWYSDRARMGRSGNPSFTGRSGAFSRGMIAQTGRLGTPGAHAATETFFIWRPDGALIVHASWNRNDGYTTISITARETQPATTNIISPFNMLNALAPPGSVRGAGGQMRNVATYVLTDTNSLARLRHFWDEPSALATKENVRRIGGVSTSHFNGAQVVRLPTGAAANAKETDLLFITPHTLSLIHVAENSNNTSQLVIGSITR